MVTFMFTDIVGSVDIIRAMACRTGAERDIAYHLEIKEPLDTLIRDCVEEGANPGCVVKGGGDDSCLCVFADGEEAILCALQIQEKLVSTPIKTPLGPLQIRIGIHMGNGRPINGEYAGIGDYTGADVSKAARVLDECAPGCVLLSQETHSVVRERLEEEVTFEPIEGLFYLEQVA